MFMSCVINIMTLFYHKYDMHYQTCVIFYKKKRSGTERKTRGAAGPKPPWHPNLWRRGLAKTPPGGPQPRYMPGLEYFCHPGPTP